MLAYTRTANIKNSDYTKLGKDAEKQTLPLLVGMENCTTTLGNIWQLLIQLKMQLPYDLSIMFMDTYPREIKISVHTKTFIQMFIAALFIIAKTWKQSNAENG